MGKTALRALTGLNGINERAGKIFPLDLDGIEGRVYAVQHPAYVLYDPTQEARWKSHLSIIPRLINSSIAEPVHYTRTQDPRVADAWLQKIQGPVAFDYETTNLDPWRGTPTCVSFCHDPKYAYSIDLNIPGMVAVWIKFLNSEKPKIVHNVLFEYVWSLAHFSSIPKNIIWDTMIASHVFDENQSAALEHLALRHTDINPYKKEFDWATATFDDLWYYNCTDSDATMRIALNQMREMTDDEQEQADNSLRYAQLLSRMRFRGVQVDTTELPVTLASIEKHLEAVSNRINESPIVKAFFPDGLNLRSPKQMRKLLFGALGLKPTHWTDTDEMSTGKEFLERAKGTHPIIPSILDYKGIDQIRKNFLVPISQLVSNGYVHPVWHISGTKTHRLSCSEPNMQNNPKRTGYVKKLFIPRDGNDFIEADYSQIELRVLAALSGEKSLLEAFELGLDVHRQTAAKLFKTQIDRVSEEQRDIGKTLNFGVVYGITEFGLEERFNIPIAEGRDLLYRFWAALPSVDRWIEKIKEEARTNGFVVSPFGRVRHLPDALLDPREKEQRELYNHALRQACNFPVQQAAAEITLRAMLDVERIRGILVVAQVHDSILVEAPSNRVPLFSGMLKRTMEAQGYPWLTVKLVANIKWGKNWFEMYDGTQEDPEV